MSLWTPTLPITQGGTGATTVSGARTNLNIGNAWTTPTFSAGDFTANGSMTWTVESSDVITYAYIINGKTMTVSFKIDTTTVGGTPSTLLKIAIPAGKVSAKKMENALALLGDNSASHTSGICIVSASGSVINIKKRDGSAFTASTNLTYVRGQITFEIN